MNCFVSFCGDFAARGRVVRLPGRVSRPSAWKYSAARRCFSLAGIAPPEMLFPTSCEEWRAGFCGPRLIPFPA